MTNREVCADKMIARSLTSKWEESLEVWDDENSRHIAGTCLPELTSRIAEMGDEGREVASEMDEIQRAVREAVSSC